MSELEPQTTLAAGSISLPQPPHIPIATAHMPFLTILTILSFHLNLRVLQFPSRPAVPTQPTIPDLLADIFGPRSMTLAERRRIDQALRSNNDAAETTKLRKP